MQFGRKWNASLLSDFEVLTDYVGRLRQGVDVQPGMWVPHLIKVCEHCGDDYVANEYSPGQQKYCNRKCKEKAAFQRLKDSGQVRKRKGGYNRTTYVTKFMEARQSDMTAPCHYCGKRLSADSKDWVLDHKIPISEMFDDFQNPDNLVVCCSACNYEKGTQDYQEFVTKKQKEINHD